MNSIDYWLKDMINKGLASTTSSWIERAVEQRIDKMTVNLASSVILIYNDWDRIVLQLQTLN